MSSDQNLGLKGQVEADAAATPAYTESRVF
jgi:hypothetical protein